jgi:hypothetical protein
VAASSRPNRRAEIDQSSRKNFVSDYNLVNSRFSLADEYPENNIDVPKTGDGCKNAYGE